MLIAQVWCGGGWVIGLTLWMCYTKPHVQGFPGNQNNSGPHPNYFRTALIRNTLVLHTLSSGIGIGGVEATHAS